jgi:DNA uptake protein ComE-like DNA-binding protein
MKFNSEPIKNWFGFSRQERRATFILLILTVLIIGVRNAVPDSGMTVRDVTGSVISAKDLAGFSKTENTSEKVSSYYNRQNGYKAKYEQKRSSYHKAVTVAGKPERTQNSVQYSPIQQKPLMDINLSDSITLVRLPGIGPVLSSRIIKYRRLLGGFARIEQLKEVYGLPPETYELIKGRIFADSSFISRININTAAYKELSRLHYLEKYEITSILKYRELKGRINNIRDLTENKLITIEKARRVGPYLKFDE